jgi:GAF domain-containing protein
MDAPMDDAASLIDPAFGLETVVANGELETRPTRAPDHERENRALNDLARELAHPRGDILKKLTDSALALCRAHTAGISILEMSEGKLMFRWHAISGAWAHHEGSGLPRDASPCGAVIDHNRHYLMVSPERRYVAVRGVEPAIREVLLLPFTLIGAPVGTIWVIAHDDSVRFDREDRRILGNLAAFAATAHVLQESLRVIRDNNEELQRLNARLRAKLDTREHGGEAPSPAPQEVRG